MNMANNMFRISTTLRGPNSALPVQTPNEFSPPMHRSDPYTVYILTFKFKSTIELY